MKTFSEEVIAALDRAIENYVHRMVDHHLEDLTLNANDVREIVREEIEKHEQEKAGTAGVPLAGLPMPGHNL